MAKENLKRAFANLIEINGENNELETFQFCSEDGIELAGSTIDKIVKTPDGNILFYYNENTNDLDSINAFEDDDLLAFLDDITHSVFRNNRDTIADHILMNMRSAFTEASTAAEFAENIVDRVMEDIEETADLVNWNDSDIDLALERVLLDISL